MMIEKEQIADEPHQPVVELGASEPYAAPKGEVGYNTNPNPEPFVVQPDRLPPSGAATGHDNSDAESGPTTLLGDEAYPEGGWKAWSVVLGSWCGLVAALGLMNTIGAFQTYVATHQLSAYSEGTIGWIFSVYTFLAFGAGVYIGPIFDKHGPRWLIAAGSVCVILSVMLLSICTEYWHFFLAFGVLNGCGTSLLFTPCVAAIGHFFKERRGLATGLASTGGGVGGVVFPLMLARLFDQVGWAWAIRILGFLCLALIIFANLLVRKRLPPATNASTRPDFRILKEKAFLLTTIGIFLLEFGLFIPLAYISSYALSQGFGEEFAFQILPILNGASVIGRALPGWWADKIGPFNSNLLSVLLTLCATWAVWLPAGHTTPGLIVFAVLFGFGTGNTISITPVCIGQLCSTQHYGRYYATCYTVVAFACLVGFPIAGAIIEASHGSYTWLIVFVGLTQCMSFGFLVTAKVITVGWKPWTIF